MNGKQVERMSVESPATRDGDVAIRVRGVTKRYSFYDRPVDRLKQMVWRKKTFSRELTVLHNIDFDVRSGETIGVIGRNGAGKSTLLQIIAGTLFPSEGSVEVKGRVAPLIELGAGFNPEFSGHDNAMIYGQLLGMSRAEIESKYDDIVRFADIGEYIERPVKTYSSGMYARLAFAVAIHVDPKILIVDEILAVGDAPFQQKCLNRFYQIKETGCTILVVAHDQYLVRSICDRAIYLKSGRLVAYGPAGEVTGLYLEDIEPQMEPALAPPASASAAAPAGEALPALGSDASEAILDVPKVLVSSVTMGNAPAVEAEPRPQALPTAERMFEIVDVALADENGNSIDTVRCGDTVALSIRFRALTSEFPEAISFVFNLYRHDGFYVCGSTTLMEGMPAHRSGRSGKVTVTFPQIPLLAGKYVWRVAINDHGGLLVHTDAKGVCPFRVVDDFQSVGLVHLQRSWCIVIDDAVYTCQ